jgi:hypothetical protein
MFVFCPYLFLTCAVHVQDAAGHVAEACTMSTLARGAVSPITAENLRKALGSTLGCDTPFQLRKVNLEGMRLLTLHYLLELVL